MPKRTGYSAAQITLHWAIVALIGVQLLVNAGMQQGFADRMNGTSPSTGWAVLHIALGLAVLGLAALRLGLRLTRGTPPPPPDNPVLVTWAGMLAHLALYLLMFAMPLTGAIAWFGHSEIAAELHELGQRILALLIGLHVLGALVEHFIFGQNTLLRMFRTEGNVPRKAALPRKQRRP
jgi:cytochrome b561